MRASPFMVAGVGYGVSTPCRLFVSVYTSQTGWQGLAKASLAFSLQIYLVFSTPTQLS